MLSIRLPKQLEDRLNALAASTHRTKAFYAREAIEQCIEDWEDGEAALQVLRESTGKYYTTEEVLALCNVDESEEEEVLRKLRDPNRIPLTREELLAMLDADEENNTDV